MKSLRVQSRRFLLTSIAIILCLTLDSHLRLHAQTSGYREVLQFGPDNTSGMFYSLAYSPDDRWIAVGTYDPHTIEIRSASTGQILKVLTDKSEQGSGPLSMPIWSPNGQFIAEVSILYGPTPHSDTGIVNIWEAKTGNRITIPNRTDSTSKYADPFGNIGSRYIAWHPNGKELLIMDNDRKIRLLDFPSGKVHWVISPYVNQPAEFVNAESEYPCRPQWNSDGSRFVCIGDGIETVFDGVTGNRLFDLQDEVGLDVHPKWTPDGRFILNVDIGDGGNSYAIESWDALTGKKADLPTKNGFPFSVSPDSIRIAYVDRDSNQVVVALLKTDDTLARFDIDYNPVDPEPTWSADGRYLAVIDRRTATAHIFTDMPGTF